MVYVAVGLNFRKSAAQIQRSMKRSFSSSLRNRSSCDGLALPIDTGPAPIRDGHQTDLAQGNPIHNHTRNGDRQHAAADNSVVLKLVPTVHCRSVHNHTRTDPHLLLRLKNSLTSTVV